MKTDEELVKSANELALEFYSRMGYKVRDGYRFDKARHPTERMCWDMAVIAFDHISGSDVESALDEIEDE